MDQVSLDRQSLLTTEIPHHQVQSQIASAENVQPPKPTKIRIESIDVYRGLTMVGMILVDNMGGSAPWFLSHPEWDGLTPADFIFPAFLFIMGLAIPLAVSQNRPIKAKNMIRIAGLFLIGFFLNLLGRKFDFTKVRILGILQRLSICYAVTLLIQYITNYGKPVRRKIVAFFMFGLYLLYLALMISFDGHDSLDQTCNRLNNLTKHCNFATLVDKTIFTTAHCWRGSCPDPEGIFSTIGAIITTYMGYQFSLIMQKNKAQPKKLVANWLGISIILGLLVYPMTLLMPFNKQLYTSSFTLIVIAVSGASLTFFYIFVDILPSLYPGMKKCVEIITAPLKWLGLNPLAIFVGMDFLAIFLFTYIKIDDKSVLIHFYQKAFRSWIQNAEVASTVFACFFLILWTVVAGIMHRFKLYLRL